MRTPITIHIDKKFLEQLQEKDNSIIKLHGKDFGNLIHSLPLYFKTLLTIGDTTQLENMNPNMKACFETISTMIKIEFGKTIEEILIEFNEQNSGDK
jgi:hypothetical protein